MADPPALPRERRPRLIVTLAAAALFLAAIWSVLWLFLSKRAEGAFQTWLATERAEGRQWTCPGQHIGGYPFAVTLSCDKATFRGEVAGRTSDGSVQALTAGVRLDQPRRLSIALRGPLVLRSEADDFDVTASWTDLVVTIDDVASRSARGRVAAVRLAVTLETVGQGDLNLRAATATGDASPAPTAPGDIGFTLAATGVTIPTADPLPGLDQPADVGGRGVLVRADLVRVPTRAQLEAWRLAGGALHLSALDVAKGAFRCTASGTLELDEAHRPAGKLDMAVAGFEPIAQRFGLPIGGVRLGGLLSNLLGGTAAPAGDGGVHLAVSLEGGRVSVGPFRTGVRLEPLY